MPYKVQYSENPSGVTTMFYGTVTDDDIRLSCIDRTSSDEKIVGLKYILDAFVDVSEFVVTVEGVKCSANFAVNASTLNKELKYLSIMPTDLLYGMSRMWQAYTDDTEWERNIVRTRYEAEQWLKGIACKI